VVYGLNLSVIVVEEIVKENNPTIRKAKNIFVQQNAKVFYILKHRSGNSQTIEEYEKKGQPKWIYSSIYRKKHPKRIAHLKARRYATEQNAVGSHSFEEWEETKRRLGFRCAICRKETKLTKDHIIPLSKNGTDFITNIQPLCRNCNSRKWKKLNIYSNPELLKNEQR